MALGAEFKLSFNGTAVKRGLDATKASVVRLGGILKRVTMGAVAMGTALVASFAIFAKSASGAAAEVESLESQFTTLLKSETLAKKRMEEIAKFAASTPFEIAGLARASKMLETMGGELLATGAGLRMTGDAAAVAGVPLEEIATHIGRLFNQLQGGPIVTESANRLLELGVANKDLRQRLDEVREAQKRGDRQMMTSAEALAFMQEVLGSTEGAMARLAETTEGKLSNMQDNLFQLKVAFGEGFNDGLKIALDAVNSWLPKLMDKFQRMGKMFGTAMSEAVQGDTEKLQAIGSYIGLTISGAMEAAMAESRKEALRWLEDINPFRKSAEFFGIGNEAFMKRGSEKGPSGAQIMSQYQASAQSRLQAAFGGPGEIETRRIGNQMWRYQSPNAANPSPFRDENGRRMVLLLENINDNLARGGSKM